MTGESRVTMHKGAAALVSVALVVTGAGVSYLVMRNGANGRTNSASAPAGAPSATLPPSTHRSGSQPAPTAPIPDAIVSLTPDAVERAGITVAPISSGESATEVRLPGAVQANAYRQVAVTPVVAGRVIGVSAQLGTRVRRGQTLAQIYSPELAEAQTKYVSARAMLDAHDRELQRTRKLVGIGAASRQELERIHAEHAAQAAAVQSARSQLELLGVPRSAIDALESGRAVNATTSVPAPIDGVVTERAANVGLNVDQATQLFTVVDLSTVWITADVHEQDFSRVRVGSDASITTAAYPGSLRGRVNYIDPQVNPETRTAKIRVEVSNLRGELKLGMYADVVVSGAPGASVPLIPRSAVQNVGDRTVVYLANPKEPGKFTEREVHLGQPSGERVEVTSGVQAGDVIVTEGSFFVRAERERAGSRPAVAAAAAVAAARTPAPNAPSVQATAQTAKIVVNEEGFEPAKVSVRAGTPASLTFIRTTDKTCATEVVFPALTIKRSLPLKESVQIDFTPAKSGELVFACGMNMQKGVVVVQ